MKKKETEIATNVSSGAEKVETVEKELKKEQNGKTKTAVKTVKKESAKGDSALGDSVKQTVKKSVESKADKESEAAKARVERALKKKKEQAARKEAQAKKKAERQAAREKRIAERKAVIEKRLAEKKALAEKRAAEKEAKIRERAHAKANRNQERAKRRANRNRKNNADGNKKREKGYGGWIAAVVALGVTTLALATTVTVGAMEMKAMKEGMMTAQRGTMYELTGIMEHVDDDLDRIRVSSSSMQQSRILTDLLVQARLAEADLEKLPISMEKERNITEFLNRTAAESERMLSKLRNGGTLSKQDMETLESLYKTNHSIRTELDKLTEKMTDQDWMDYMKDGKGMLSDVMNNLENMTLAENRAAIENKMEEMKGAGMQPKSSNGAENKGSAVDTAKAEELCATYFSKYNIQEFQCVGETVTQKYSAYNVQGFDEKGSMLFAEVDRNSGDLIRFDYYEECSAEKFDMDNAERIAQEFLKTLGYEDLTVARYKANGSTVDFTFVYEEDGVVYYPDTVHVKVCRSRGVVSGMDAAKYLKNHRGRDELNVKINMETAYKKLSEKLSVEASRLAVVDTARGERAAYEFLCSYGEENYYIFLDAGTGEEIAIINVNNVR